jgi:thiol:disulfide interchange protein DsbC
MMMKKTILTAAIAGSLMSLSAFAQTTDESGQWAELEKNLRSSSEQLANAEVTVDVIAQDFQAEFGDQYTPVTVSGVRFLADKSGSFLLRPDSTFYLGNGEIQPLRDPMIDMDLASMEGKWPSLPLPEGVDKKGDVYVFTDPTCTYCQKFEESVDEYLEAGVQVNYIPFPRAGISSTTNQGYQVWAGALCSGEDVGQKFHQLMTDDKAEYDMPESGAECLSRLHEGYNYGRLIGVTGTPYIFVRNEKGEYSGFNGLVQPTQVASQIGVLIRPSKGNALN